MSKKKKGIKFSKELTPAQVEKYKSFGVPDMSQNWLELFSDDLVSDLFAIMRSCSDNQKKAEYVEEELKYYGFTIVGEGTNILVMSNPVYPGVVFKIALDDNGVADNFNDCILQDCIPRYIPVYARHPSSIVSVQQRGVLPTPDQMIRFRPEILKLLKEVSKYFLIADLSPDMFLNYVVDRDGKFLICDGSDLYPLHQFKNNKLPRCKRITGSHLRSGKVKCCEGRLHYTEDFKWLVCEKCGNQYNPLELRPKKEVEKVYQMLADGFTAEERADLELAARAVINRRNGLPVEEPEDLEEDDFAYQDHEDDLGESLDEEDEDLPDVDLDDDDEDDEDEPRAASREVSRTVIVYPDRPAEVLEEPMDDEDDEEDDAAEGLTFDITFNELQQKLQEDADDDEEDEDLPGESLDEDDDDDDVVYEPAKEVQSEQLSEDVATLPDDLAQVVLSSKVSGTDIHQGLMDYLVNKGYTASSMQTVPSSGENTERIIDEGEEPEKPASIRVEDGVHRQGRDERPLSTFEVALNDGNAQPTVINDVVEYLTYLKRRNIFMYSDLIQKISESAGVAIKAPLQSTDEPNITYSVETTGSYPAIYVDVNADFQDIDKAFDAYGLPIFVTIEEYEEYYQVLSSDDFKRILLPVIHRIHADAEEARIEALNQSDDDDIN